MPMRRKSIQKLLKKVGWRPWVYLVLFVLALGWAAVPSSMTPFVFPVQPGATYQDMEDAIRRWYLPQKDGWEDWQQRRFVLQDTQGRQQVLDVLMLRPSNHFSPDFFLGADASDDVCIHLFGVLPRKFKVTEKEAIAQYLGELWRAHPDRQYCPAIYLFACDLSLPIAPHLELVHYLCQVLEGEFSVDYGVPLPEEPAKFHQDLHKSGR